MAKNKQPELKLTIQDADQGIFILEGVRPTYPNLFRPGKHKGTLKPRLDTNFLLDAPNAKEIYKQLEKLYVSLAQEESGKIKKLKDTANPKLGKDKDTDCFMVKTTNALDKPPVYFNRDGEESDPMSSGAEAELYAGCYARVKIRANSSRVDKDVTVWSNLEAIQFMAKGERLGGGGLSGKALQQGFGAIDNDGFDDDDKKGKKGKKGKKSKKGKDSKKGKNFKDKDLDLD